MVRIINFLKKYSFWFLFSFFLVSYVLIGIQKHFRFETGDDLALYSQPVWFFSKLKTPLTTIQHTHTFNDHFQPILIFFAPFYWIWADPLVLIILQQIIVVIGIIPLYFLAKKLVKKPIITVIVPFLYLYFIGIQSALIADFHPAALTATLLSFTIYFLETKKWKLYWLSLFFSLICREDVPLYIFSIGLYLLLLKKEHQKGLITMFLAFIYYYSISNLFLPLINGVKPSLSSHGSAGNFILRELINSPVIFFKKMFFPTIKLRNILLTSFSFGFLPFFSPLYWLVAPTTFLRYIIPDSPKWSLHYHYAASLTPILAYSSLLTLAKIKKGCLQILLLCFALIGTFYTNKPNLDPGFPTPPISFIFKRSFWILPPRNVDYHKMISLIPPNASVSAQNALLPHLCHREKIYRFPDNYKSADYIALTFTEGPYPLTFEEYKKIKENLLQDESFKKLYFSYAGVLLKKK